MTEYDKAIEILDKLDFFYGQRAGRELWAMKPVDVQNEDIKSFVRDIEFLKTYIKDQKDSCEDLAEYLGAFPKPGDYRPKGKWIVDSIERTEVRDCRVYKHHTTTHTCSLCHTGIIGLEKMLYCPYCGAKMIGETLKTT